MKLLLLLLGTWALADDLPELRVETWLGEAVTVRSLVAGHDLTLLNVWAVWCPPCREELPLLLEGHEAGRYNLVALNFGDAPESVSAFLLAEGLVALPTYFISVRQGTALRIPGLPATLALGRDAERLHTHYGPLDEASLAALLEKFENGGTGSRGIGR
jgi:thiol-disulfide isomerase/thioredoxin